MSENRVSLQELTLDAAAERLGVHVNTVQSWLDRGLLPSLHESTVASYRRRLEGLNVLRDNQDPAGGWYAR